MLLEEKMNIKNSVLDYIKQKQLNWYGHVLRMDEERCPPGRRRRRRRGKSRNSWIQEVTSGMREKGINNMKQINREERRRKIKFQAQKDVQTSILRK